MRGPSLALGFCSLLLSACHGSPRQVPSDAPAAPRGDARTELLPASGTKQAPVADAAPEASTYPNFMVLDAGTRLPAGGVLPPPCVHPFKHAMVMQALDAGTEVDLSMENVGGA